MKQSWIKGESKTLAKVFLLVICFFVAMFITFGNLGIAQIAVQDGIQASDGVLKTIIVNEGDSLSKLATKYGITVGELMTINSLRSTAIMAGQSLFVPLVPIVSEGAVLSDTTSENNRAETTINSRNSSSAISQVIAYESITVSKGDTLGSLALTYGSSIESIQRYNELTDQTIFIGQNLEVPLDGVLNSGTDRLPNAFGFITVLPDDTIGALATTFCTSPESLMGQNGLLEPTIYIGQRLFVGQLETLVAMPTESQADATTQ